MKHWDLTPREIVTIESGGHEKRLRFCFRTTLFACFETLDTPPVLTSYQLVDDGGLRSRHSGSYFRIGGEDRNTRTVISASAGRAAPYDQRERSESMNPSHERQAAKMRLRNLEIQLAVIARRRNAKEAKELRKKLFERAFRDKQIAKGARA